MKKYSVFITTLTIVITIAFVVLFLHGDYDSKLLIKLGLKERPVQTNWAIFSWESSLNQLDYDSDIVFFGDSLTQSGDFQYYFENKKIVNLGYSGDSITGMTQRINMVKAVMPEKIFLMGGINNLNDNNIKICVEEYATLLKTIRKCLPNTKIYVQSVLPVLNLKNCSNSTIKKFNNELKKLSTEYNTTYIDLFSIFIKKNEPKTWLYKDNVHINSKGYKLWTDSIRKYVE